MNAGRKSKYYRVGKALDALIISSVFFAILFGGLAIVEVAAKKAAIVEVPKDILKDECMERIQEHQDKYFFPDGGPRVTDVPSIRWREDSSTCVSSGGLSRIEFVLMADYDTPNGYPTFRFEPNPKTDWHCIYQDRYDELGLECVLNVPVKLTFMHQYIVCEGAT